MHGGLALKAGVLFVGRCSESARVAPFDLDGRRLGPGFTIDGRGTRAGISGLAVDDDRRLWIADSASACLRGFTAFGRELGVVGSGDALDVGGIEVTAQLGRPVDVVVRGTDVDQELIVVSGGSQRHALRVLPLDKHAGRARPAASLRPLGDPRGSFLELTAVDWRADEVWILEAGAVGGSGREGAAGGGSAGRIQVFRHGDYHYSLALGGPQECGRAAAEGPGAGRPEGLALLADGRALVAFGGEDRSGLVLLDAGGRRLSVVARAGKEDGCVWEPTRLAVEEGVPRGSTRVAVMDCDGDRVQVFSLAGRCYGAFQELP